MNYLELKVSNQLVNPIHIVGLPPERYTPHLTTEESNVLDDLVVGYFENKEGVELPDIVNKPCFMIANDMKKIWQLYVPHMTFKGVQVFSIDEEDRTAPLYWVPVCEEVKCLHPSTRLYDYGGIEELVLEKDAIQDKAIFKIGDCKEYKIIISLAVAESLLRRGFYGLAFEQVKMR